MTLFSNPHYIYICTLGIIMAIYMYKNSVYLYSIYIYTWLDSTTSPSWKKMSHVDRLGMIYGLDDRH